MLMPIGLFGVGLTGGFGVTGVWLSVSSAMTVAEYMLLLVTVSNVVVVM